MFTVGFRSVGEVGSHFAPDDIENCHIYTGNGRFLM